ncbi:HET-domain-containing protein, partial [Patellaria atrata CBS 101060]
MIDIFGYVDVINASNEDVRNISECIIQRDTVNTGWIEIWLEQCRLKHKGTCAKKETICLPFLRLIDCETRVIKGPSSDETPKYLALSYVWGAMTTSQSSGGSRSIINGAKLGKLPPVGSLPKVIEDAISITKTLGHRYLWIDQYCIDQEDGDDIKVNLSSMHLIYGTASITLIAAAGKDQTFGLPGVGQRLRSFQPVTRIGKLGFISLGPAPKRWIDTSKYMTRGWTYQEGLFSRRKIFFTEYQVYVECRSAHCSE